jgi:molybdopterin-synthase adenylyltransferase
MFKHTETSVALAEDLHQQLCKHLIRKDKEEDLIFALWTPSAGISRFTSLLHSCILPTEGDRQRHGNVSFNPQYFKRVCQIATQNECGIAFLHSHPGSGWQAMSKDDINAEFKMAGAALTLTGLPLLGLTVGSDGTWSARHWKHLGDKRYEKKWCHSVRVLGTQLKINFTDFLVPQTEFREEFRRTVTIWGAENHQRLSRSRIGIVGLGSVGRMVAEILALMGFSRFVFIDYDEIQRHNQDRFIGSKRVEDIGALKVDIAKERILESANASKVEIITVPYSIAEEEGYRAALDCDILFNCVDRPRPRHIPRH